MSRYIDADSIRYDEDVPGVFIASKTQINNIPTADVRENVTAKKIVGGGEHDGSTCWFECSRCQTQVDVNDKYCSNCGAEFVD